MIPDVKHVPTAADPFSAAGERVALGSDRPFLLEGEGAWVVTRGAVDVFAVRVADGVIGTRVHLVRVAPTEVLFPLTPAAPVPADRYAMLAVATAGTEVVRLSDAAVWTASSTAPPTALLGVLDRWIEALCGGVAAHDLTPSRCVELAAGDEVRLSRDTAARPHEPVAWVRHVEGHSYLLGQDTLAVNGVGYTPIARPAWLQIREPARIEVLSALAVARAATADPQLLRRGLDRLHALVLGTVALQAAQARTAQEARATAKTAAAATALTAATRGLANSLQPPAPAQAPRIRRRAAGLQGVTWDAALFAACRLIGDAIHVPLRGYPLGDGRAAPRDPIAAIARASGVRVRRVALRAEWWRTDHGPLLGHLPESNHPVALLRAPARLGRPGGYRVYDAVSQDVTPVDATTAARIGPFAHTFYRPFPDTPLALRDVLRFGLVGCRRDLLKVVLLAAGASLLGLVPALVAARLFNEVIPGADRGQLLQLTLVLLACALANALFQVTRTASLLRIETRLGESIQCAVWDRLLALPMPFFRDYAAGDLAMRAMSVDAIRQIVSGTTITAILAGVFSLFNFALMFKYSAPLAWRATGLIAAAVAVTAAGSMAQLRYARGAAALQAKTSGLVLQLLSSVGKLRVAGAEPHAFAIWAARFAAQRQLQHRGQRVNVWVGAFNAALPAGALAVLFSAAIPMLRAGTMMRTGDFLAFLAAYGACQGALLGACAALLSTLAIIPLYEQARPILMTRPEVGGGQADPGVLAGDVDIQHAVFRYTSDGPQVLRDISIQIRAGEFVAFVGPSGSGKSTLLRLLLGFEKLESGGIYYDGQELGALDVQAVRRQIGVVLQNGRVTAGDLFTNIAGSASASLDDAWEAARMAGLADDVRAMPMGLHTVVSDGGGTLSGGQRQRLMIARAVVHRPRLLYFDEATSALDNHTQAVVSASLNRLQSTRVVVAHRLSTIERADRIFVIDRGRVAESGSYDDLLGRGGLFTDLARRQLT